MKILVFDLDNTLCQLGKPVLDNNVKILKALENSGNMIVICSGKPTYYLCGLARQLGLNNPVLIGENGAVIQFGVDLPPREYFVVSKKTDTILKLKKMRKELEELFGNRLWFQPNEVCLTPFPYSKEDFIRVQEYLNDQELIDCKIYNQIDCFDIIPDDVSKFHGLAYLSEKIGVDRKDFIAIGDSLNDYPMFEFAKVSIGISMKDRSITTYNFDSIDEALIFLLNL